MGLKINIKLKKTVDQNWLVMIHGDQELKDYNFIQIFHIIPHKSSIAYHTNDEEQVWCYLTLWNHE